MIKFFFKGKIKILEASLLVPKEIFAGSYLWVQIGPFGFSFNFLIFFLLFKVLFKNFFISLKFFV